MYIYIYNLYRPHLSPQQNLQAPSVAAELLVSSALRMLWPADARCGDASSFRCRKIDPLVHSHGK